MTITTMSSQEFNENIGRAKKATQDGPVLITEVGRPGYVLLTIEEYQRLTGNPCASQTLAEVLAMPGAEDIDFDPQRMKGPISRVPDRSSFNALSSFGKCCCSGGLHSIGVEFRLDR